LFDPARPPKRVSVVYRAMKPEPTNLPSRIILQGVHLELTAAMQNIIREKFSVLLRHHERIIRINVRLHQDQKLGRNHHYTATGQIEIGGPDIVATAEGEEAYVVLDKLVEILDKRLRDRHEIRKDKRNHPHGTELQAALPKTESR
jgi:putative sigma-54 modulation protein